MPATKLGMKRTTPRVPIKRVSQKQKAELALRAKLKKELITQYGERCQECGSLGDWRGISLSHTIPLGRGGKTQIDNLELLCYPCHSLRHHIVEQ